MKFQETVKSQDDVKILLGPVAVNDDGVVGTAQIIERVIRDFKTKEDTGNRYVELVFTPSQGRAEKIRVNNAIAALTALGVLGDDADEDETEEGA